MRLVYFRLIQGLSTSSDHEKEQVYVAMLDLVGSLLRGTSNQKA
jgi:hypothetical protein